MVVVEVVRPAEEEDEDEEEELEQAVVVVVAAAAAATVDLFKLPVLVLAASPCSLANALVPGLAPAATSSSSLV